MTTIVADGITHHAAGRFNEAIAAYSDAIDMTPDDGNAWRLLGVIALQTGDIESARNLLGRSVRIDPTDAAAYSALGSVDEAAGCFEAAYAHYTTANSLDPEHLPAIVGLTRAALRLGRARAALAVAEAAVARGMRDVGLVSVLGAARLELGDYVGAAGAAIAALQIAPCADTYANLGAACVHLGRIEAAIAACKSALSLDPAHAEAANNLGIAHRAAGASTAAMAAFERAAALGSDQARINLGTTQLLLGDYHRGWPNYGWANAERRANPAHARLPLWDGSPLAGRRLLIWPEQGIGDTIQMARFLSQAQRGGNVTLACPLGTKDLLRSVAGVDAFIDAGPPAAYETFDAWLPVIRLPVVFDVAPDAIPTARYLSADPQRVERFRARLRAPGTLRVGLVWSGNPEFRWNGLRSCGLHELEPLRRVAGITWFALQQGSARELQANSPLPLVPVNTQVADFADTAAIIEQLDLIVTVDTSVAHLAGALGRPAWVLLSNRPDWRWQLDGERSPWYPTLRLFRQGADGTWPTVIAALAAALREAVDRSDQPRLTGGLGFPPA